MYCTISSKFTYSCCTVNCDSFFHPLCAWLNDCHFSLTDSPSNNPNYLRFYVKRGFSSDLLSKSQLSLFRKEYMPSSQNTFFGDPFLSLKCESLKPSKKKISALDHVNHNSDDDAELSQLDIVDDDDDTCSSSSSSNSSAAGV